MKSSDIDYINKIICKFIQDMSIVQDVVSKEAPDVWSPILMSMSTLSDVSVFLEAAKSFEEREDLKWYNKFRIANGLSPVDCLPKNFGKNHDRPVDLSRFKVE